jgi:hypothetical protein
MSYSLNTYCILTIAQIDIQGTNLREKKNPPKGMLKVSLYEHQQVGLAWMLNRESGKRSPIGGLLADDQVSTHPEAYLSLL